MPDPVRSLDRIKIASPCNADWESMIGNDQVRFCEHCNLHVTDLSSMSRQKAQRLVARSQGRLCARFIQRPDGGVLTKQIPPQLYLIGRRVSRLAAGAFTATLTVASVTAQTLTESRSPVNQRVALEGRATPLTDLGATLSGVVTDPNGAVVSGATVTLMNSEKNVTFSYSTGDDGVFKFSFLDPGLYRLVVEGAGFAKTELTDLTVAPAADKSVSVEMQMPQISAEVRVEAVVTSGVVSFVAPEEPLVKAAFDNKVEAVNEQLLSFNVNVRDKATQMTALDCAVENGDGEIVKILISAGANARFESEKGRSALMYLRESATTELVRDVLSAGANVNARDESGETPLMNAVSMSNFAVVEELIKAGARVDGKDGDSKTVLMYAASNESPRIAKLLIESGANVNAADDQGNTALMIAAGDGEVETVRVLIQAGAEINSKDDDGMTPLMRANDVESVLVLLNAGADMSAKDNEGRTALALARKYDQSEIVKLLVSRGASE